VSLGIISFQLLLALVTQAIGIFVYPVVLLLNILAALASLYFFFASDWKSFLKSRHSISWFVPLFFIIAFFCLFSVHYHYSGRVSTFNGKYEVKNEIYPYPYFSDEWIGVALANYSLASHHLPLVNPLLPAASYEYFVFGFYALIAELFLLVGLQPLLGYSVFALIAAFGICILAYQVLRSYKVSPLSSVLSVAGLLYVVNGANLPGLWYLLPFVGAFGVFLIMLGLMAHAKSRLAYAASIVSFFLYPPLIIFIFPAVAGYIYQESSKLQWKNILKALGVFIVVSLVVILIGWIFTPKQHFFDSIKYIVSLIVRPASDPGFPNFYLWYVVPFPFFAIAFYGMYLKRRDGLEILLPVLVGLFFWFTYSSWLHVFVIDYSRVTVITSWLLVLISGFATDKLLAFSDRYQKGKVIAIGAFLILFLCSSFSYTKDVRAAWLTLYIHQGTKSAFISPAAPASVYLSSEDIRLFEGITKSYFLAPAWKGLVISSATGNYPLDSKQSTIANHILSLDQFMRVPCEQRKILADKKGIQYVYAPAFSCSSFAPIGTSTEGLVLYKKI